MSDVTIARVVLELHGVHRDEAHAWHERMSRWASAELPRRIDSALGGVDNADHVVLSAVEVDIGRAPAADLEHVLGERVGATLAERVRLACAARAPRADGNADPPQEKIVSALDRRLELLGHFLESGALPWWAPRHWRLPTAVDELLPQGDAALPALLRRLASHPHALRRLVLNLDENRHAHLLEQLRPGLAMWLERWHRLPGAAGDVRTSHALVEVLLRACAEGAADVDADGLEGTALLGRTLAELLERGVVVRRAGEAPPARRGEPAREARARDLPAAWLTVWDAATRCPPPARAAPGAHSTSAPARRGDAASGTGAPRASAAPGATSRQSRPRDPHSQPATTGAMQAPERAAAAHTDPVSVPQAGLVLLWPFLPAFFEALELRRDGEFRDGARERAVQLLNYLATGEAGAQEYELALPKLLCGWGPALPIAPGFDPDVRERVEADELLRSVISHWSALGGTSVQGFRDSFLHRTGQLTSDDEPLLRVERRGYDVLLEHLPYSISMIALSWMGTVLRTEW